MPQPSLRRRASRTRQTRRLFGAIALFVAPLGCFGIIREPARHYFVLHLPQAPAAPVPVPGMVRVRDLDTESAYDRLGLVVRRSPYELTFRARDTWAVKPGRMLSDALARAMAERHTFVGVTRELSERRPDYLMAGELHALEVDQSTPRWQAHLSVTLQLSAVGDGTILWTRNFDERESVAGQDYAAAVQAFSRAFARITDAALAEMGKLGGPVAPGGGAAD